MVGVPFRPREGRDPYDAVYAEREKPSRWFGSALPVPDSRPDGCGVFRAGDACGEPPWVGLGLAGSHFERHGCQPDFHRDPRVIV
jgi:hypothetical protein